MRRLQYILSIFFSASFLLGLSGQDPVFSQFYNAPIQLNPGLVGLSNSGRVSINYRNQWTGWPQAYSTYAASFDQYFDEMNSGFGMQVLSDNAGDGILKTTKISGVYSYHLQLNKDWQARVGLEAGMIQTILNWDKLIFEDQIVPEIVNGSLGGTVIPSLEIRPDQLTNRVADFSVGGLLYGDQFYVGVALKHLTSPNNGFGENPQGGFSGLPPRFTIHGGMQIDLDGYNNEGFGSFIAPSILYTRQAGLSQLNAGALYNRESVFGGVWLRHTLSNVDAAIISVGLRTEWLKLSYSFDLTLSSAQVSRTSGSHEIGVVMIIGGQKNKKSRIEDCFSIFR